MSLINLILYVFLIIFSVSALSGIVMFFVDMMRFGTPHKRFETVSSIEKYNENLARIENEINDSCADESEEVYENFEIDL